MSQISVIVPAWNAESTLTETLDSIRRQTLQPAEVLLIDDGSNDSTARMAQAHPLGLRYCPMPGDSQGPAAARNLGLRLARCPLLTFLDADDLWPDDALQRLNQELSENPGVDVVQGRVCDFWPDGRREEGRFAFNLGSALFRRDLFANIGEFNPLLRQGEDVDLWIRAREHGVRARRLEEITLLYRRKPHRASQSEQKAFYSGLLRNLKASLDRRGLQT